MSGLRTREGASVDETVPWDCRVASGLSRAGGETRTAGAKHMRESWRYETDHQVTGSPIVHEGSVYCGSVDGSLYCLDFHSGRLRWRFHTSGSITGTPAVFKNTIIIGSMDHKVYALIL